MKVDIPAPGDSKLLFNIAASGETLIAGVTLLRLVPATFATTLRFVHNAGGAQTATMSASPQMAREKLTAYWTQHRQMPMTDRLEFIIEDIAALARMSGESEQAAMLQLSFHNAGHDLTPFLPHAGLRLIYDTRADEAAWAMAELSDGQPVKLGDDALCVDIIATEVTPDRAGQADDRRAAFLAHLESYRKDMGLGKFPGAGEWGPHYAARVIDIDWSLLNRDPNLVEGEEDETSELLHAFLHARSHSGHPMLDMAHGGEHADAPHDGQHALGSEALHGPHPHPAGEHAHAGAHAEAEIAEELERAARLREEQVEAAEAAERLALAAEAVMEREHEEVEREAHAHEEHAHAAHAPHAAGHEAGHSAEHGTEAHEAEHGEGRHEAHLEHIAAHEIGHGAAHEAGGHEAGGHEVAGHEMGGHEGGEHPAGAHAEGHGEAPHDAHVAAHAAHLGHQAGHSVAHEAGGHTISGHEVGGHAPGAHAEGHAEAHHEGHAPGHEGAHAEHNAEHHEAGHDARHEAGEHAGAHGEHGEAHEPHEEQHEEGAAEEAEREEGGEEEREEHEEHEEHEHPGHEDDERRELLSEREHEHNEHMRKHRKLEKDQEIAEEKRQHDLEDAKERVKKMMEQMEEHGKSEHEDSHAEGHAVHAAEGSHAAMNGTSGGAATRQAAAHAQSGLHAAVATTKHGLEHVTQVGQYAPLSAIKIKSMVAARAAAHDPAAAKALDDFHMAATIHTHLAGQFAPLAVDMAGIALANYKIIPGVSYDLGNIAPAQWPGAAMPKSDMVDQAMRAIIKNQYSAADQNNAVKHPNYGHSFGEIFVHMPGMNPSPAPSDDI